MSPIPSLLASVLLLAPGPEAIQVGQHTFHRRALPNGLQALAVDDGEGGTISIFVVYAVGNRAETRTTTGIAHLTEHALFTGTPTTPLGKHDAAIKALRGESNAYTRDDFTAYYAHKLPPSALDRVLRMEADRMRNLTWAPKGFRYERTRLEREEAHTNKTNVLQLESRRDFAVWAGRGYGAGLLDAAGHTRGPKLSLAQVRAFYDRWYHPRNAAVIVVGAKPREALRAIARAFGKLPAGPRPPALDPPALGGGELTVPAPLTRPRREWVWMGPSIAETRDRLALLLLAKLCKDRKGVDGRPVSVWQGGRIGADLFVIAATGDQAAASVAATWKAIRAGGWSEAEVAKAKGRLRDDFTSVPIRSRPYFSLAVELGVLAAYGHADYAAEFDARVGALTLADLRAAANRWLTPARRTTIVFRPTAARAPLPTTTAGLRKAAEEASGSGDYERAIKAYEALLKRRPGRVDTVIYRYSLGSLNRKLGRLEAARKHLLAGLKVVEYPALRELLKEVEQDLRGKTRGEPAPASRPTSRPARPTSRPAPPKRVAGKPLSDHKLVGVKGVKPPPWAAEGTRTMGRLEAWRGLAFKRDLTVEFRAHDPKGPAGWYEPKTGRLVVTMKGSARFGRGTMLHEMFHALQDQHYDLTAVHAKATTPDAERAVTALIEGEAMLAVQELMSYDFSRHAKVPPTGKLDEARLQKVFHYGHGLQLVLAIRKARGWAGVRAAFANPPTSTAQVYDPKRYLSGWRPLPPSKLPKAVVGPGERLLSSRAAGEYEVRRFLLRSPKTRARADFFARRVLGEVLHRIKTNDGRVRNEWVLKLRPPIHGAPPARAFAQAANVALDLVPARLAQPAPGAWVDGDRVTLFWHSAE